VNTDYDAMYEEVKKSGNVRHMRPRQIKFKEGDVIVGKFLGREELTSKDPKMPNFFVYTFERANETVRFPVSGVFDKNDGSNLKVGGVYALEYLGKLDLGKGKEMKEIDTIIISEPEDEEGEENGEEEEEE